MATPRTAATFLIVCSILSSCRGEPEPRPAPLPSASHESDPAQEEPVAPEADRAARANEHIRAGRFREARELLDELVIEESLAVAERELARGSPEDALLAIDDVLEISPHHSEGRFLKGRASLALAEKAIAAGGSAGLVEGALQDALEFFRLTADRHEAVFGAIRTANLLGDSEEALHWARKGRGLLHGDAGGELELASSPHRILSEAFFNAYANARAAGAPANDVRALFMESEDALESLLGRTPEDPWGWSRLSDLYEWEGDYEASQRRLEDGLARAPQDTGLLERLARVARRAGGTERSVAALEAHVSQHSKVALAAWLLARERFDLAVELFAAGERSCELFSEAEDGFARARELDPSRESDALSYAVVCRAARGWCAVWTADLQHAEREFLSMNDLFDGGIAWSLPDRIESGIAGLAAVGDAYYNQEDLIGAAEAFSKAHEFEPGNTTWANNAGFFLRDAAEKLEQEGRRLCAAARGASLDPALLAELRETAESGGSASGDAERELFRQAANERLARARAMMLRSQAVYRTAVGLSPDDVALLNDTALISVYYLHNDLDEAEQMLHSCVAKGAAQIAFLEARLQEGDLSAEDRELLDGELFLLKTAWGDAHQNLGVLHFLHRNDPARALEFLERAVEIGPDPRPDITNNLLPLLRDARDPVGNEFLAYRTWGEPCP